MLIFVFVFYIHDLFGAAFIGSKRQVPNKKRRFSATRCGTTMNEHFIEGNRQRCIVAVNDHGGRVSDEADIDGGHVEVDSGRVIVGSNHCDGLGVSVFLS